MGGIKMLSPVAAARGSRQAASTAPNQRAERSLHARLVGCRRADNDRRPLLQTVRAVAAQSYRDIDIIRYHHAPSPHVSGDGCEKSKMAASPNVPTSAP